MGEGESELMIHAHSGFRHFATSIFARVSIIFLVSVVGALWLYLKGPMPVFRGSVALPVEVPFWYMLLAFPILGMLAADLVTFIAKFGFDLLVFELAIQIVILIILSNLRLSKAIPLSGHGLLLGYFILRRLLIRFPRSELHAIEIGIACVLLAIVAYMKLFRWSDPFTLCVGLSVGCALALVSFYLLNRLSARQTQS